MLLPYYNSGQVKGMVTGLAGGEEYAQAFVRPDGQSGLHSAIGIHSVLGY